MRHLLILTVVSLLSGHVFAQQAGQFELQVGTGLEISNYASRAEASSGWSTDRNLSASALYDLTDHTSLILSLRHLHYTFSTDIEHGLSSYYGYGTAGIERDVKMAHIGYRLILSNQSKTFSQYGSVGLGVAHSVSSTPGYYFGIPNYMDLDYTTLKSGYTTVGLISIGVQAAPFSFLHLFAELEIPIPFRVDLVPGPIALRGGVGISIFTRSPENHK